MVLGGCSSTPIDENDPASLMADAEDDIQSNHYQIAIEKLRTIKNKFPYSKHATDSQIRIADVYFLQESFAEAALTYEVFRDLHPKHEKTAYAMFRIGKSYFNDMPGTVARDLTSAQRGLDAYRDFMKRFPTDPQAKEAEADIVTIRDTLAAKELYIGNFYYRSADWDAAKARYMKIQIMYPETETAKQALTKLESIEKLPKKAP